MTVSVQVAAKKALLGEALDVAVVGDTEPIPFVERPEFAMLGEGTREERTARGIANLFDQLQRSAGVWQAIVEAASSDPAVDEWRLAIEERRRIDVRRSIERVLDREVDDSLLSVLWVLYSSETYRKLVIDSGMSRAEYERVLVDASLRLTDG